MTALVSTAYLPPVAYMAACVKCRDIVIETRETFPKQTYRNRCCIAGPNGRQILVIPVIRPRRNHTPVKDIRTDPGQSWQKIHWRSIETAYNKSPFFLYYRDDLLPFFRTPWKFLLDLNTAILESLFRMMRLDSVIAFTGTYESRPNVGQDLRVLLTSKHQRIACPPYTQVFSMRLGFLPNLSIIDLLCNLGPDSVGYLSALPDPGTADPDLNQ